MATSLKERDIGYGYSRVTRSVIKEINLPTIPNCIKNPSSQNGTEMRASLEGVASQSFRSGAIGPVDIFGSKFMSQQIIIL